MNFIGAKPSSLTTQDIGKSSDQAAACFARKAGSKPNIVLVEQVIHCIGASNFIPSDFVDQKSW